jgi:hypothetical protein
LKKLLLGLSSVVACCSLLTACSKPIPTSGTVYIAPVNETVRAGAIGNLLGKHFVFKVDKVVGPLKYKLNPKQLLLRFDVDNRYTLYKGVRSNWLVSEGSYSYSLNANKVKDSRLMMLAKDGLNVMFHFKTIKAGTFNAWSNNPDIHGSMSGTFIMNLNK